MPSLPQLTQFAAKLESIESTPVSLAQADLVTVQRFPSVNLDLQGYDRDHAIGTLSRPAVIPSLRSATTERLAAELVGVSDSDPTTTPLLDALLQICGYRRVAVKGIAVAASWTTGTNIPIGTELTASGSGAVVRVVKETFEGEARVWYEKQDATAILGTDDLEATGIDIDVAEAESAAYDGFVYELVDEPIKQISAGAPSGTMAAGEEIVGGTSGARGYLSEAYSASGTLKYYLSDLSGNFQSGEVVTAQTSSNTATTSSAESFLEMPSGTCMSLHSGLRKPMEGTRGTVGFRLRPGEPIIANFELTGVPSTTPFDFPNITTPTQNSVVPPLVNGSTILFGDDDDSPTSKALCFQELTFNTGNTVTLPICPSETAGYRSARITARSMTGSVDPETVRENVFAQYGKAWTKAVFRIEARVGTQTANTGNAFVLSARQAQIGNITEAERDGYLTSNLDLMFRTDVAKGEFVLLVF